MLPQIIPYREQHLLGPSLYFLQQNFPFCSSFHFALLILFLVLNFPDSPPKMEPENIDWDSIDSTFIEDDTYEDFDAPKWVDLSASDEPLVDDEAWFCTHGKPFFEFPLLSEFSLLLRFTYLLHLQIANIQKLLKIFLNPQQPLAIPRLLLPPQFWFYFYFILIIKFLNLLKKEGNESTYPLHFYLAGEAIKICKLFWNSSLYGQKPKVPNLYAKIRKNYSECFMLMLSMVFIFSVSGKIIQLLKIPMSSVLINPEDPVVQKTSMKTMRIKIQTFLLQFQISMVGSTSWRSHWWWGQTQTGTIRRNSWMIQ